MPRRKRTKKERERFLIREFLSGLGYRILRAQWPERPDALVKVTDGARVLWIGIEHTDYHVDAPPGVRSPGGAIRAFWRLVQASLVRRISHRSCLQSTRASVSFRRGKVAALPDRLPAGKRLARSIASELVDHALAQSVGPGGLCISWSRDLRSDHPLLASWLNEVTLWRQEEEIPVNPYFDWRCVEATAACIGPVKEHFVRIVGVKAEKARTYCWRNAEERWLLVVASGSTPYSRIGPWTRDVEQSLASARPACETSPFDHVFVWERIGDWHKQVWPDAPVVHLDRR